MFKVLVSQSCLTLCDLMESWTVAHQTLLSMEFSRQVYWSGLPGLPAGDLPNSGIKPTSLVAPALTSRLLTTSATREARVVT